MVDLVIEVFDGILEVFSYLFHIIIF